MKFITDAALFTATFAIMITPTVLTVGIIYFIFK